MKIAFCAFKGCAIVLQNISLQQLFYLKGIGKAGHLHYNLAPEPKSVEEKCITPDLSVGLS